MEIKIISNKIINSYLSDENQIEQIMSLNELKDFNDFLQEHRKFNLTIEEHTEYPDTSFSPEQIKDFKKVKKVIINCNGLTFEEYAEATEELSDGAVFFIQNIFAQYEQKGEYFVDTELKRLKELYTDLVEIENSEEKINLNITVELDKKYKHLKQSNFTNEHFIFIQQCLDIQKGCAEKVLNEYKEVQIKIENKPFRKIGFKSEDQD